MSSTQPAADAATDVSATSGELAFYKGMALRLQTELAANSFNALLHEVLIARDIVRAGPSVPVHPWLSPKYAGCGGGRGLAVRWPGGGAVLILGRGWAKKQEQNGGS